MKYFIIGFIIGVFLLPVIRRITYERLFNNWIRNIIKYPINFLRGIIEETKDIIGRYIT